MLRDCLQIISAFAKLGRNFKTFIHKIIRQLAITKNQKDKLLLKIVKTFMITILSFTNA
jgi:hypothetical protein